MKRSILGLMMAMTCLFGMAAGAVEVMESEPNNSLATADILPSGGVGLGVVNNEAGDPWDWWILESAGMGYLAFAYVDPFTNGNDSMLELYDVNGSMYEMDDNDGSREDSCLAGVELLVPGSLYAAVGLGAAVPFGASDYDLTLAIVDPNDVLQESEPNDRSSSWSPVEGPISGSFPDGDDRDYFFFEATAGERIAVLIDEDPDRDGNLLDGQLDIYGPDGNLLVMGDNNREGDANCAGEVSAQISGRHLIRFTNSGAEREEAVEGSDDRDYRMLVLLDGEITETGGLFGDGFESGDTTAWSSLSP